MDPRSALSGMEASRRRRLRGLLMAAWLLSLSACASVTELFVTSDPTGAMIQVDNRNVGEAPVLTRLDFDRKKEYLVTAVKPGYFTEEELVGEDSAAADEKKLRFVLMEDEAWKVTTTSEATNAWLRFQVDPKFAEPDVWQKLVDSVTSRYSSLEQMDAASGYMRTVSQVRRFRSPSGEFRVRTRFLCSMSSRSPLVYKFRIEAERSDPSGDWIPYERVFKEDAALIEELSNRLGVK